MFSDRRHLPLPGVSFEQRGPYSRSKPWGLREGRAAQRLSEGRLLGVVRDPLGPVRMRDRREGRVIVDEARGAPRGLNLQGLGAYGQVLWTWF